MGLTEVRRAAVAVASYGLPGVDEDRISALVEDAEWSELLDLIRSQRLTGLLSAMADDGMMGVDTRRVEEAHGLQAAAMTLAVLLERRLLEVARLLDERSIEHRVLKGPSFARLHYGDPALRPFGDIDLLIAGDRIDEALGLLEGKGGRRRFSEPRPGFVRRFGKGASIALPDGIDVDVHRTLALGPFGVMLDPSVLFERETRFVVGGRLMSALALEERCLHACYHAVLGHAVPRLLALRDVAQVIGRLPVALDHLVDLARSAGAEVVVARATTLAWDTFDLRAGPDIVSWARSHRPDQRSTRMLDLYQGASRSSAGLTLRAGWAIPGWRDRARYGVAVLFPRGSGPGAWSTRWASGLRSIGMGRVSS